MEDITYKEFIQNILDTRGRFACGEEYHERHHIKPKCLGGNNKKDNLIDLFAREHFEAHRLLALENPNIQELVYAWWCMSIAKNKFTKERYVVTKKEYEEMKKLYSKVHSEAMSGENSPMFGRRHSVDSKEKMRDAAIKRCKDSNYIKNLSKKAQERLKTPENNPMYGKHKTKESTEKQGKTRRENHSCEKIVVQLSLNDDIIKVFWSTRQVERELLICCCDVSRCCNGNKYKSAGGYHWKYLYDNKLKNGKIIPGAITLGLITEEEALKQLEQNNNCMEGKQ